MITAKIPRYNANKSCMLQARAEQTETMGNQRLLYNACLFLVKKVERKLFVKVLWYYNYSCPCEWLTRWFISIKDYCLPLMESRFLEILHANL